MTCEDGPPLRMQLHNELGTYTKVAPTTSDPEEEIRVRGLVSRQDTAICSDYGGLDING